VKVAVVVHGGREEAVAAGRELVDRCREQGIATRSVDEVDLGADERTPPDEVARGAGLLVSVGGDGTLLRAAFIAASAGVPVLGVNVGRLGFLAEFEPEEAPGMIEAFASGDVDVEERMTIVAEADGAEWHQPQWALNEVMVEKRARHRVITLGVRVGNDHVTTFSGDGVIVATPTGSTAYSFSARGPIVSPVAECLVVTPVAPHMVFDRSLVLPPGDTVTLEVQGEEPGLLSADGRPALELPLGCRVVIRRSDRPVRLLRRRRGESFYAKLRRKFSLPRGPRGEA
jgi:NAD+ kinase